MKQPKILFLVASILFLTVGIVSFFEGNSTNGNAFIVLGFANLALGLMYRTKVVDFSPLEQDEIFKKHISENDKIKAIKRCRVVTGCGLKEALDYVEKTLTLGGKNGKI